MAVLQNHPRTLGKRFLDKRLGTVALALAQRHKLDPLAHRRAIRKTQNLLNGIAARTEQEHHRGRRRREILPDLIEIVRWRINKLRTEIRTHKALNRHIHLVRANEPQHKKLLEHVKLVVPARWQRLVWIRALKERFPVLDIEDEIAVKVLEPRQLRQPIDVLPRRVAQPAHPWIRHLVHLPNSQIARQKVSVLRVVNPLLVLQNAHRQQKREEQLVLRKQRLRHRNKQQMQEMLLKRKQMRTQVALRARNLGNPAHKQLNEPRQRVLIHRINALQISNAKVQHRTPHRKRTIVVTRTINILLRLLGLLHLGLNLITRRLGLPKRVNQHLVIKKRALGRRQEIENLVFNRLELILALRNVVHHIIALLLKLRLLNRHHRRKKLVLEPRPSNREIDQRHLGRNLGKIVRIAQLGRQIQTEVLVELNHRITHADHRAPAFAERRLEQHRIKRLVELFANILDNHRNTILDATLERAHEIIRVAVLDHNSVATLLNLEPGIALVLWINQERETLRIEDDHRIVARHWIARKPIQHPVAHLELVCKRSRNLIDPITSVVELDAHRLHKPRPFAHNLSAVRHRERTQIRNDAARKHNIAKKTQPLRIQLLNTARPAHFFVRKRTRQLARTRHARRAVAHRLDQRLLARHCCPILVLHVRNVLLNVLEPIALLLKISKTLRKLLVHLVQQRLARKQILICEMVLVQRTHPNAQALARLGTLRHNIGNKLRIVDIRRDLLNNARRNVIAIKVEQRIHKSSLAQHRLGNGPVLVRGLALLLRPFGPLLGRHIAHNAHGFHHKNHTRRRIRHRLDLRDVALVQRLERLLRCFERRKRKIIRSLGLGRNLLGLRGLHRSNRFLRLDLLLLLIRKLLVNSNIRHQLLGVARRNLERRRKRHKLFAHLLNQHRSLKKLPKTTRGARRRVAHRVLLLLQQMSKRGQQPNI
eukprot:comp4644_c0_seq1/m.3407 comp4644_c0_seq1/g.3407  ORF comp4644_c0_seq1/g.3407 comp4644_c0_seq1/m.3407 type:complete len:937 (-) comp4644_c0_seq1:302-3112(-)